MTREEIDSDSAYRDELFADWCMLGILDREKLRGIEDQQRRRAVKMGITFTPLLSAEGATEPVGVDAILVGLIEGVHDLPSLRAHISNVRQELLPAHHPHLPQLGQWMGRVLMSRK